MAEVNGLIVGEFYWVIPVPGALGSPGEWANALQPARFAGTSAEGELLWNYPGISGCSDWPVMWIDERIEPPRRADIPSARNTEIESVQKPLFVCRPK